jgi:DNA polymerase V
MQADLFSNQSYKKDQHELMNRVDEINKKYGKRTTHIAGTGIEQNWQMKQEYLSDGFTTQWDELMEVQAD